VNGDSVANYKIKGTSSSKYYYVTLESNNEANEGIKDFLSNFNTLKTKNIG